MFDFRIDQGNSIRKYNKGGKKNQHEYQMNDTSNKWSNEMLLYTTLNCPKCDWLWFSPWLYLQQYKANLSNKHIKNRHFKLLTLTLYTSIFWKRATTLLKPQLQPVETLNNSTFFHSTEDLNIIFLPFFSLSSYVFLPLVAVLEPLILILLFRSKKDWHDKNKLSSHHFFYDEDT